MKNEFNNLIKLLLNFHKALLDAEKASYEEKNGPISDNGEYFQLVVNHDDFKWLRSLSEMIAQLDLITDKANDEAVFLKEARACLNDCQALLSDETDSDFYRRQKYFCEQATDLQMLANTVLEKIAQLKKGV